MSNRVLQLPLTEADVRELVLGDMVHLSGEIVITAGMPTHQRMVDELAAGRPLPRALDGGALIHFGAQSREVDGRTEILYMNPTTSTRFNPFMPGLIRGLPLRVVGGKGGLNAASAQAMRDAGCVYLSFPGGACTLLSNAIREVISVDWTDLLLHYRLVRLRVHELGPATVAIDADGHSLYTQLTDSAQEQMPAILEQLRHDREQKT
jgi:fumarate hydratase subunit beta